MYQGETKAIAEVIEMMDTKLTVEVCKETIIAKEI